ncbi:MAG: YdcF family protein [Planctomycetaceae bacterium]|nr:YdcF family protein [Planctomycetaceae bacterium]
MGVSWSDIIEEGDSLNTYENAVKCSELLRRRKVRRIILVTEGLHMPRALRAFRKQGVEAIPSGCNYRATGYGFTLDDLLPDLRSVVRCQEVFHEWAGAAWYWLRGRIH